MEKLSNRERILTVLRGEVPDHVPWFGDLSYWHYAQCRRGTMPEKYQGNGLCDLHRELGVGFYLQGYWPFRAVYDGMTVEDTTQGDDTLQRVVTPLGELTSLNKYIPDSYCWGPVEHLVKTADDLPAFRYMLEHTRYEPDYAEAERRFELVGDNGIVLCYLPRSPLMEMVTTYAGIETLVYIRAEDPDGFAQTMELLETRHNEAAALALASPAESLMIPENLSSEVVGKRLYEEYMRPYEERWIARVQKAGKYSFVHMDGTLQGLLREVASAGFTVLEALTPAPAGDMALSDIRGLTGPAPVIWGGLPGMYFTPLVSDEEFERFIIEAMEIMSAGPGYVLGVADQVPPDGIWERIRRVEELVKKFGWYR